jgi:hypothetical protein
MTEDQNLWDQQLFTLEKQFETDRRRQYEAILGQIQTGVFILEPMIPNDPQSLEVTLVNEMGTKFFGRANSAGLQVLIDASH